ncbi:MAG TPA: hypothetical protein PKY77_17100 [Phycisphaerae bacterium]|nr:hypothetical protein [Phycisphaerae bacterium]HRY66908.1 hypothetical protein [Phycisphaerae bacterium]
MDTALLILTMTILAPVAQADPPRSTSAGHGVVLKAGITAQDPQRRTAAIGLGREAGVRVGDPFWIVSDSRVYGRGSIFLITDTACVGQLTSNPVEAPEARTALIVRRAGLAALRDQLPEPATLRGQLTRLPPGRRTGWLNLGRACGLREEDPLLVRREGIPIARGRIALLEDDIALTTLQPLVGNALPQPGDGLELWPAPALRRNGQLNSAVLAVQAHREGALVTLAGTAEDGLVIGRLVDLYRGSEYVGVAVVTAISEPLSVAQMIESASRQAPEVGDTAIIRPSPAPPLKPILAAVFRVAPDQYCLVAAGESDGVAIGDKFIVRRPDPKAPSRPLEIAELTVKTVKVEHCGADVKPLGDGESKLAIWDFAERVGQPVPRWQGIGAVREVDTQARTAILDADASSVLIRGQMVRWLPVAQESSKGSPGGQAPGAALLIHPMLNQAMLYVPPGWGRPEQLEHARIEVPVTPTK